MTKRISTLLAALTLFLGAGALPAHAQSSTAMTPAQIDARYDAAKKQCGAMRGDQKDICFRRAEADKDMAEA